MKSSRIFIFYFIFLIRLDTTSCYEKEKMESLFLVKRFENGIKWNQMEEAVLRHACFYLVFISCCLLRFVDTILAITPTGLSYYSSRLAFAKVMNIHAQDRGADIVSSCLFQRRQAGK